MVFYTPEAYRRQDISFRRMSSEVMMFSEFAGMNDFEVVAYLVVIPETGQDEQED
jgi:hypothetical protein